MLKFISSKENISIIPNMKQLYLEAFPSNERAPFSFLVKKAKKEGANLYQIENDGENIGLLYTLTNKDILYIFYFAIQPEHRGKGFGTTILQEIQKYFSDKRIILNFEEVDEKYDNYCQRLSRKNFYLRNGFKECHIKTKEFSVVYEMVYFNENITYEEYAELMQRYLGKIAFKIVMSEVKG